jgi:hypothetical protein
MIVQGRPDDKHYGATALEAPDEQAVGYCMELGERVAGLATTLAKHWPTKGTCRAYAYTVMGYHMDLRRMAAMFAIAVGAMMFAQWAFFIAAGEVTELDTEPIRISFHLAAEFLTATALVVAGLGLAKGKSWSFPVLMLALGMLSYTIVVSPGYFAQDGEFVFVAMFAVLWILTLALVLTAIRREAELRNGFGGEGDPGAWTRLSEGEVRACSERRVIY